MNISSLPPLEQRVIELSRQAALLINQLNLGQINRFDILRKVDALDQSEQQTFRDLLNKYKAAKA